MPRLSVPGSDVTYVSLRGDGAVLRSGLDVSRYLANHAATLPASITSEQFSFARDKRFAGPRERGGGGAGDDAGGGDAAAAEEEEELSAEEAADRVETALARCLHCLYGVEVAAIPNACKREARAHACPASTRASAR